jgi:hypothetical protein
MRALAAGTLGLETSKVGGPHNRLCQPGKSTPKAPPLMTLGSPQVRPAAPGVHAGKTGASSKR